jgi:hypothetical protein
MLSLPPKPAEADMSWDALARSTHMSDDIYIRHGSNPELASYLAVRSLRQEDGELPLSPPDSFNVDLQLLAWTYFNDEALRQQHNISKVDFSQRGYVYQIATALKFKRNLFYKVKKLQKQKKKVNKNIRWPIKDIETRYQLVIRNVFMDTWTDIVTKYGLQEFSKNPIKQLDILLRPTYNQFAELAKNLTNKVTTWDAAAALKTQKGGSSAGNLLRKMTRKEDDDYYFDNEEKDSSKKEEQTLYIGVCGGAPVGSFPVRSKHDIQTVLRTKHNCPNPDNLEKAVCYLFYDKSTLGM